MTAPLWTLALTLACTTLLWLLSLRLKDASIIDIYWGPGIALVADLSAILLHAGGLRASATLLLVNFWAVRLGAHIFARHRMIGEDHRYAAMRKKFGRRWWWASLVQVFLLQAILIWFIAAPTVAALLGRYRPLGWMDLTGFALVVAGLLFETIADFQLARFRLRPANAGKVMDRGLWAWSRHPNYFGEAMLWWGFFLIGYSASGGLWLALSPVLVTILLLHVSGVTLMEETIARRRPAYADYARRVSVFVPWPPKR